MKKFLSITLSILMTFFITGCGSKQKEAPINNDPENSNITNMEDYELYYGKISSVAGNEIEVSIAKDPYENLEGQDSQNNDDMTDGSMAMTMSGEATLDDGSNQGGAEERIEMEYTGETKSFTIPAGAKITEGLGQEGKISSLKKGSVIMILANKESGVVADVTIMD